MPPESAVARCGFVAVVGRPNVGKSTLVNRLVGQKLSITSSRAQTTRHRILGIKTAGTDQIVFVDTPGIHARRGRALNRQLNRTAIGALVDVDAVVLVVEAGRWTGDDDRVLARVVEAGHPMLLAVNKVDRIADKARLLPFLAECAARAEFAEIVPVSATRGTNLERLEAALAARLPAGEHAFPDDAFTDRSERFLAAEIVREKLIRRLGQEVPHRIGVEIERFADDGRRVVLGAVVWVESAGQKAMVIGRGGQGLKAVGTAARRDIERLLGRRVHLEIWVKVREGWSDDERALRSLGYAE